MQGTLFIVAAPSGAGKTTLVARASQQLTNVTISISYTTRPPRPQEVNGEHYHFVDEVTFLAMVERGEFLEHAMVLNQRYYYGTSQKLVKQALAAGDDVILEIDWQGAQQVRRQCQDAIGIFIVPPSRQALASRLAQRQQDSEAVIAQRLQQAKEEMSHYPEFDYLIVNQDFDTALAQLCSIIEAQRLSISQQTQAQAALLQTLLA